jgi:hypothetical protein
MGPGGSRRIVRALARENFRRGGFVERDGPVQGGQRRAGLAEMQAARIVLAGVAGTPGDGSGAEVEGLLRTITPEIIREVKRNAADPIEDADIALRLVVVIDRQPAQAGGFPPGRALDKTKDRVDRRLKRLRGKLAGKRVHGGGEPEAARNRMGSTILRF